MISFYAAANLARAAYQSGASSQTTQVSYHADTDTRAVVTFDKKNQRLLVSFRGTYSLRNWFRVNFRFSSRDGCHKGVAEAIDYHAMVVQKWVETTPWSNMIIVGHSLGGALANELARRMWDLNFRNLLIVTFGAVRAHTKSVVQESSLGGLTVRVVNNNDLVSRILGWSFDHIGRVLYFDRKGRWHHKMPWWLKLWDALAGRLRNPGFDVISDHDMDEYVELCENIDLTVSEYLES